MTQNAQATLFDSGFHRVTVDAKWKDDLVYAVWSGNVVIARFRTRACAEEWCKWFTEEFTHGDEQGDS